MQCEGEYLHGFTDRQKCEYCQRTIACTHTTHATHHTLHTHHTHTHTHTHNCSKSSIAPFQLQHFDALIRTVRSQSRHCPAAALAQHALQLLKSEPPPLHPPPLHPPPPSPSPLPSPSSPSPSTLLPSNFHPPLPIHPFTLHPPLSLHPFTSTLLPPPLHPPHNPPSLHHYEVLSMKGGCVL